MQNLQRPADRVRAAVARDRARTHAMLMAARTSRWRYLGLAAALVASVVAVEHVSQAGVSISCAGRAPTILGTAGNDKLIGTTKADVFWAGDGNDIITGGRGDDIVCSGPGDDVVSGGGGNDRLEGAAGVDELRGDDGRKDVCVDGERVVTCEKIFVSEPPTTTTSTTTSTTTTTAPPPSGIRFETLPPGSPLPSGAECAVRIRPAAEVRPGNGAYNATKGTTPNGRYPRVTGDFTGTTDEIIQWTACKWGIDEDVVRAQVVVESWWNQDARGDFTTNQSACYPDLRTTTGSCPESVGLMQVRYVYHTEAFVDANAIRSSAYNLDYAFAGWRSCFEGNETWLNTVERGATYAAGDMWGCVGVWFSGRWLTQPAKDYVAAVQERMKARTWETSDFIGAAPAPAPTTTAAPTTAAPTTAAPTTTVAPTTVAPTTTAAAPTTTAAAPTTTAAQPTNPAGVAFSADFTGDTGLERFRRGAFHRERDAFQPPRPDWVSDTPWQADHDNRLADCGDPTTNHHPVQARDSSMSFHDLDLTYVCRGHLMSTMGDVSGYSVTWFSPNQSFSSINEVCFDASINGGLTGDRQWWEVAVQPVNTADVSAIEWLAGTANLPSYGDVGATVLSFGPANPHYYRISVRDISDEGVGGGDSTAYNDMRIRRAHCFTDNKNGTLRFQSWVRNADGTLGTRLNDDTVSGSFPAGNLKVVFKDHAYTPVKSCWQFPDSICASYTFHWDNIVVRGT
jgi:RTX calcium-binding nonapeptide repeat (4 copies)